MPACERTVRWSLVALVTLLCAAPAVTTQQACGGVGDGYCDARCVACAQRDCGNLTPSARRLEPCAHGRERVVPVLFAEHASELQLSRSVASVHGFAPACVCVASELALARARDVVGQSRAAAVLRVDSDAAGYREECLHACLRSLRGGACAARTYALVLEHPQMLVLTPGEALADSSHKGVPPQAHDAVGVALDAALSSQQEGYLLWQLTFTHLERAAFPTLLRADVAWSYDAERAVWRGGSAPDVLNTRAFSVLVDNIQRYFVDNLQRYEANIALFERQLEADPADADAVFYLAHTLKDAGAYTRALPLFERRATMSSAGGDQEFLSHLLSGRIHALSGRREAAVACYLRAVETRPARRVEALVELAQLWRQAGEPQQALAYAKIATAAVQQDGKPFGEVLYANHVAYDVSADMEVSLSAFEVGADLDGVLAITRLLSRANIARSYWLASYDNAAAYISRMQTRSPLSDVEDAALKALQAVMTPAPLVCEHERVSLYGAPIDPADGTACGPESVLGSLFSSVAVVAMRSRDQHVARFLTSIGCSHYLRFPAVMHLTPVELLRDHYPRLRNGEMRLIQAHSCVLSYVASLTHDARPVAIFEDDVALVPPATLPVVQHMMSRFSVAFGEHGADMVLLGHCPCKPVVRTLPYDVLVQPTEHFVEALCTHAYAVTSAAAARVYPTLAGSGYPSQLDVIYMRMAQRGELKTFTNAGDTVFLQHQLGDSLNGPELKGLDETGPVPSLASLSGSPSLRIATHDTVTGSLLDSLWLLQLVIHNVTGIAVEATSHIGEADFIVFADCVAAEQVIASHTPATLIMLAEEPGTCASAVSSRSVVVRLPRWLPSSAARRSATSSLEAVAFHPALRQEACDAEAWAQRSLAAAVLESADAQPVVVDLVASVVGGVEAVADTFEQLQAYRFVLLPAAKLPLVHLAGGVPILYDLAEEDLHVWNTRRLLLSGRNTSSAELLRSMLLLQNSAPVREEWFRQPVLAAGAAAWLTAFLSDLRGSLVRALGSLGIPPAPESSAPLSARSTTVVSGYWNISSKHSPQAYRAWFKNTLRVNAGMVFFFEDEDVRATVADIRRGLHTVFIKLALIDFEAARLYNSAWVHAAHVPTAELGMIWLEKVFLMQRAARANPFNSSWFAWMDAGCAAYRERLPGVEPWPAERELARLPRDRIIYTHVQEWYHHFSGTAYMYHADMIKPVRERFEDEVRRCAATLNAWPCGNDQYLMTQLLDRHPAAFYRLGDGYGELMPLLARAKELDSDRLAQ